MRLYFVPVTKLENIYVYHRSDNHNFESINNLEKIFEGYQGEWLVFDDLKAAKQHVANLRTSESNFISPIYELEAHDYFTWLKNIPFQMRLNPTELRQMTISRKDLLSVIINEKYFILNRELKELREIERLEKYLFSFDLNDCQKKAALELVNCLTGLKGDDRNNIVNVVYMSICYVGYRDTINKKSYEMQAELYLTQSSEDLQVLGKTMLAFTIVFAVLAAGLMAVTSSISIPAIVVIPTIGLLSIGLFAGGCRHQTRLSGAMHGFSDTFENLP